MHSSSQFIIKSNKFTLSLSFTSKSTSTDNHLKHKTICSGILQFKNENYKKIRKKNKKSPNLLNSTNQQINNKLNTTIQIKSPTIQHNCHSFDPNIASFRPIKPIQPTIQHSITKSPNFVIRIQPITK